MAESSKALQVNLAETKKGSREIPPEHEWFCGLSRNFWGVNERTKAFFEEYHHPYPDYAHIVEELKRIAVGDRWLYSELAEREEAGVIITALFAELFSRNIQPKIWEDLIRAFGQFLDTITGEPEVDPFFCDLAASVVEGLSSLGDESFLFHAGYLNTGLVRLSGQDNGSAGRFCTLLRNLAKETLAYWERQPKLEVWMEGRRHLFSKNYSDIARVIGGEYFAELRKILSTDFSDNESREKLLFREIAGHFRDSVDLFDTPLDKVYYLTYLLGLPGMAMLKERILWDLNKLLDRSLVSLPAFERSRFVVNLVNLFKDFTATHMSTVLDSLATLGKSVISTKDTSLMDLFVDEIITLPFVFPGPMEISDEWQIKKDNNHLKNIRVYLDLIEQDPLRMKKLLSALVVNLYLGGVFIMDTDLFQRDVSRLLNSDIAPLYKQIQHLTSFFPVYFNEIGAEGELREVTTKLDSLTGREDKLIHFLRKQIHVESNNTHIDLTERIIRFWHTGDLSVLSGKIPENVRAEIDPAGPWVRTPGEILKAFCRKNRLTLDQVLALPWEDTVKRLNKLTDFAQADRERVALILRLYKLLEEKYSLDTVNISKILEASNIFNKSEIQKFRLAVSNGEDDAIITHLFRFIRKLKEIIIDREPTEGWENIYYKRHIAAGIPSMYGQYHERKFEALGLSFRLERYASRIMERIISSINLSYVTAKRLERITQVLRYFIEGFELRGIKSESLDSNIQMLKYSLSSRSFSLDQYINIFQFFTEDIQEIINKYFISVYDEPLSVILSHIPGIEKQKLKEEIARKKEEFYRDLISSSFLIQTLDQFVGRIYLTLLRMQENFKQSALHHVMSYNPDLVISPLSRKTPETDNKIFLGAKGFFLKKLISLGYPVPDGFILTTELFRHRNMILSHPEMEEEIDNRIKRELALLEKRCQRRFGNPEKPLLLSVRSGTAFSMPGAMFTFLNVGLNQEIAEALSRSKRYRWAAWDSYRRLLQIWGMAQGIARDKFDLLMQETKNVYRVEKKREFTPAQMKELALKYRDLLTKSGAEFQEDPFLQLKSAILFVLNSWSTERAKAYREHLQIAEDWGTAVVIQRMVFGNLGEDSGTGVVFTSAPGSKKEGVELYGDYIPASQGEDVVSGLVHTYPVDARSSEEEKTIKPAQGAPDKEKTIKPQGSPISILYPATSAIPDKDKNIKPRGDVLNLLGEHNLPAPDNEKTIQPEQGLPDKEKTIKPREGAPDPADSGLPDKEKTIKPEQDAPIPAKMAGLSDPLIPVRPREQQGAPGLTKTAGEFTDNFPGESLKKRFPAIYERIRNIALDLVEKHHFPHQEIEFTFESSNPRSLQILQIRTQNLQTPDKIQIFSVPPSTMLLAGRGTGIGGGALNGRAAFTMEDLSELPAKYPGEPLILIRPDTVPDDIAMIFACSGLLTSRGGVTSHAAVTASQLGKVCVVNCRDLLVYEAEKKCLLNRYTFKTGDRIAIDGRLGEIYAGNYPVEIIETPEG